jgi:flagellar assembly protein FliH
MKPTAKYLFDEDFASGEKPTITMVEHERRRADAESQAYRRGFEAAKQEALNESHHRIASALTLVAQAMERIGKELDEIEARFEAEAVEVAVAVASKLAPQLIAREPFVEIAALVSECFQHLINAPLVSVRVGDDIYEAAKDKLEEIARGRGFEGKIVVSAEPSLAPGDCRIEWAEGGLNRDLAATEAAVEDIVSRYVAARNVAARPATAH